MSQYTSDQLVSQMKLMGYLPTGTGLTTSQILGQMTHEMGLYIPALLKNIREEFLVASVDLAVTAAEVVIPARACGAALRDIFWLVNDEETPLGRIEPERRGDYGLTSDRPSVYFFRGNTLHLVPAPSSGTLRVAYQQRPGKLVLPSDCGEVTDITGLVVTVSNIPDAFTSSALYDLVSATPNFDALAIDRTATVSGSTLTFATALPSRLAEGDYVALATQTPIPQMPYELHTVLCLQTAWSLLAGQGNARAPAIAELLKQARADVMGLLSPRNDGSMRPIVARHGVGMRRWGW